MSLIPSVMLPLGTKAPSFELTDTVSGKLESLDSLKSSVATLIMFICNHCPYVKHVNHQLVSLANDYQHQNISFVAISSNDAIGYPQDGPEIMKETAATLGYTFPYLYDETQQVAKSYQAACTPDFYLFDPEMKLVYRGQLDGSRPGNNLPVTGEDIRKALDCIIDGKKVPNGQIPSVGCNIKWKQANS